MEPCSILELSSTVLKLSLKLYKFFKALHDAPEEVVQYLNVLESIRLVFEDVQGYADAHLRSAFYEHDGLRLTVVDAALRDCKLEFDLQLSYVQNLDPAAVSSWLKATKRKTKWVFGNETLEGLTKKLEKLQGLLSVAVATSTGRNEVVMREQLQTISLDVRKINEGQETERKERERLMSTLQQFATVSQERIAYLIRFAAELNVSNDARLCDISESIASDIRTASQPKQGVPAKSATTISLDDANIPAPKIEAQTLRTPQEVHDALPLEQASEEISRPSSIDTSLDVKTTIQNAHVEQNGIINTSTIFDRALQAYGRTPSGDTFLKAAYDRKAEAVASLQQQTQDLESSSTKSSRFSSYSKAIHEVGARMNQSPTLALMFGSTRLILLRLTQQKENFSFVTESLQELAEVTTACERELVLYQDKEIASLVEQCYIEVLRVSELTYKSLATSGIKKWTQLDADREAIEFAMAKIRRLSQSVLREVDYRHRVEMREASHRLAEMQTEQHKILMAVECQGRVLESMKEERSVMSVVQEQQKIMQVVQDIQRRIQSSSL